MVNKLLLVLLIVGLYTACVAEPLIPDEVAIPISTLGDLCNIGKDLNYPLDGKYILTQDIDASESRNLNNALGFEPIGTKERPFTGKFMGSGHTIKELYINRPRADNVGLFGYLSDGARLDSVVVNLASITGRRRVGGLVGYNQRGHVFGCSTDGNVRGNMYIGGLIGYNDGGKIENSQSTATATGDIRFGGLLGHDTIATIFVQNTKAVTNNLQATPQGRAEETAIDLEPQLPTHPITPEVPLSPKIKTYDNQITDLSKRVAEVEARSQRGIKAATSVAFAVGLPGGGSFYLGRYGMGTLHVALQVGAPIGLGIWASEGGETLAIVFAACLPVASKLIDIFGSYDHALSGGY